MAPAPQTNLPTLRLDRMLTTAQVAAKLRKNPTTVWLMTKHPTRPLPYYKVGSTRYFDPLELDAWLATNRFVGPSRHRKPRPPAPPADGPRGGRGGAR